jgi:hypothetical protein
MDRITRRYPSLISSAVGGRNRAHLIAPLSATGRLGLAVPTRRRGNPARAAAIALFLAVPALALATSPHSRATVRAKAAVAARAKTAAPAALRSLEIVPNAIALNGPQSWQQVVVEGHFADGHDEDLTAIAKLTTADAGVARFGKDDPDRAAVAVTDDDDAFTLHPTGPGATVVRAVVRGHVASAPVTVTKFFAPFVWSFRNHVLPVMTKMGCNSGPCHGAAAGKNGFKLTLRGFDPDTDYLTLTHQSLDRRTNRMEPSRSLILLKPTLTIAHGGGRRFPVGSVEFQVMSQWIAAGLPPPQPSDPRIERLEVLPPELTLKPGAGQQLLVRATFSDGHSEDVTRWAKYTSTDVGVANVDRAGGVKMVGYGEAPVTVWYLSRVALSRLRVPFPTRVPAGDYASAQRNNYIDDLVLRKLESLHIPPSHPAGDAEFLRRAYLDADGILPTVAETQSFLADRSPTKRARLVDALLNRPEFVDYWAYKWSDLLLVSTRKLPPAAMWSYYNWIHESVRQDKPWNQFVSELVTATGDTRENGAANYWAIHRDPFEVSENLAKAFMGLSINCAHCHNHPLEKWTQNDYFQAANLFSRVRLKTGSGGFNDVTVFDGTSGDLRHPRTGKILTPQPIEGPPMAANDGESRRQFFANFLTSPQNPYFSRVLVNRVWKNFMGRGLVEAVDDLRLTNPPSNGELLDAMADDFVRHNFDVKYLIRTIMNSGAYQLSSRPLPGNQDDDKYYSHYLIRRLPAEVYLDAISQVTQSPENFAGYPAGTRALQLPDINVKSYFLDTFGRPARLSGTAAERMSAPNINQALHTINGDTLNDKLRRPGATPAMLLRLGLSDQAIVRYLYLACFSREPTPEETRMTVAMLQSGEKSGAHEVPVGMSSASDGSGGSPADRARTQALRDLMWAMLSSKEFAFNH